MFRYSFSEYRDKCWMWLAWRLPKRLVYFAAIRLGAHATGGEYSRQNVPELTVLDAIKRWDIDKL